MNYAKIFIFLMLATAISGCQADKSSSVPVNSHAPVVRQTASLPLLTVLPVSFSAESKRNYPGWIDTMQKAGYGNAVWQELEDILYDAHRFDLVMEPPAESEAFRRILAARAAGATDGGGGITIDLPERVLTVNVNFFVRKSESLSMLSVEKKEQFHATVHLRYFDLENGALNRAVPATGDGVADDLLDATKIAAHNAAQKFLRRIDR